MKQQGLTQRNHKVSKHPKRKSTMQCLLTGNIEDDQKKENPRTVRDEIENLWNSEIFILILINSFGGKKKISHFLS